MIKEIKNKLQRGLALTAKESQDLYKYTKALEQEQKIGHWINRHIIANTSIDMIVCSECGEEFSYDAETGISEYNYCPNCGEKMIETQEVRE